MNAINTSKREKVKIGIVGTNHISHRLADAIKSCDCAEISAVCSRSKENADIFADIHNIKKRYCDYSEFLADKETEAVYVAVPNSFHFSYAMQAISCKKHVLCEKPMTCSYSDTAELISAARDAGVCLLEAMRPAHDPAYEAVRRAIPELGRLRYVRFEFCQYSSRYDNFLSGELNNTFNPSLGNAAVLDIGIYPLYMCIALFGEPESLHAKNVRLNNGFDGCGQLTLGYGDMTADIVYSKVTESVLPSVIMGEKGSVTIDKISVPSEVKLIKRGQRPEIIYGTHYDNNMIFEIEDFYKAIREGKKDPTEDVSLSVASIMDKILEKLEINFN